MSAISDLVQNQQEFNVNEQIASISDTNTRDDVTSFDYTCYLVINYQDCKVGAVAYRHNRLELLNEMYEFYDFNFICKMLKMFEPSDVIVSTKCDTKLMLFLKKFALNTMEPVQQAIDLNNTSNLDESNETDNVSLLDCSHNQFESIDLIIKCFVLHILPERLFQFEQCKNRIIAMNLPQTVNMVDEQERYIYLTSHLNFTETNVIKSLGVMLHFIEMDSTIKSNLNHSNTSSLIQNMIHTNLNHFVRMDHSAFEALEIFQSEWHPSVSNKGIYKKEGLSLYGIFNCCASKVGSYQLKKLFLQPITDYDTLQERLDTIEFFINQNNLCLKNSLIGYLKNIRDLTPILNRLKSASFLINDFYLLYKTISNIIAINNAISKLSTQLTIFHKLTTNITIELNEIIDCLNTVIDFEKSTVKITINKGIDTELDNLKSTFNNLPQTLSNSVFEESFENEFISKYLEYITIIYIPQLGFLIALPLIRVQQIDNIEKHGFELIFCANDSAYYKNSKTKEFDNHFGDIMSQINDRTHHILICVKDYILERKEQMNRAVLICGQLDSFIALAQTAISYHYTKPILTCKEEIKIVGGRHPLYELITETFNSNDYSSDVDHGKIVVLFGPNSSGKSVYLKQVSLIIYLAHIGSYVPAKFSEITIVDQIYTRLRTPESISTQLSSFKHDLNQMIMATKFAKQRSFVIIDFFGKGTLSIDGYSLLTSFINYWASNGSQPHLIVSSQFNLLASINTPQKVRFLEFESQTFKLIECIKYDNYNENFEFINIPASIKERAKCLSKADNFFQIETTNSFPKLIEKQRKFIEIADLILSETNLEDIIKKVSPILRSFRRNA